ncbi:MAG: hypothetical protein K5Q68_19165 [Roseococcus sp.]|nr:hypothetical protein [Roseococcus sp.]
MRQIILAAAALIALVSHADAAARIPAPATSAIQLTGGFAHGTRPALPRAPHLAQVAPTQGD